MAFRDELSINIPLANNDELDTKHENVSAQDSEILDMIAKINAAADHTPDDEAKFLKSNRARNFNFDYDGYDSDSTVGSNWDRTFYNVLPDQDILSVDVQVRNLLADQKSDANQRALSEEKFSQSYWDLVKKFSSSKNADTFNIQTSTENLVESVISTFPNEITGLQRLALAQGTSLVIYTAYKLAQTIKEHSQDGGVLKDFDLEKFSKNHKNFVQGMAFMFVNACDVIAKAWSPNLEFNNKVIAALAGTLTGSLFYGIAIAYVFAKPNLIPTTRFDNILTYISRGLAWGTFGSRALRVYEFFPAANKSDVPEIVTWFPIALTIIGMGYAAAMGSRNSYSQRALLLNDMLYETGMGLANIKSGNPELNALIGGKLLVALLFEGINYKLDNKEEKPEQQSPNQFRP